ncbi:MAG: FAD-dependent oxidoreductase [Idiomarina sp.]|nr:FAD-dependent oxidoreductase [Idiomarina sp.]
MAVVNKKTKASLVRAQVAIVGAGIVGLSLAIALAKRGRQVVVLEKSNKDGQLPKEPTLRVSAINLAAQRWLTELDVWPRLTAEQRGRYTAMQVWDRDQGGAIGFSAEESDETHLGDIVENAVIEAVLWQCAEEAGVELINEAVIESVTYQEQDATLALESGALVLAQLVVAADGGRSQLREEAGLPLTFRDYEQQGIVATLHTEEPHRGVARQVFLPGGPLALLPLANAQQVSIVWSVPTTEAQRLQQLSDKAFAEAVTVASDGCLGLLSLAGSRAAFPLRMQYAEQWLHERLVLIGDAAHTIHPLAGQGANLGIGDAWYLSDQLNQLGTLQGAWDPTELARTLRHYERARKTAAVRQIATMEGFHQLFRAQNPVVRALRSVGLNVTDRARPLKRFFLSQANQL